MMTPTEALQALHEAAHSGPREAQFAENCIEETCAALWEIVEAAHYNDYDTGEDW